MHRFGPTDLGAFYWQAPFAPVDGAGGGGFNMVFGGGDNGRAAQLSASWDALLVELRGPVESVLRGGMSAGDIAYRLGELVHGFYRTRGVTLASYELRRIVIALLDCHRRGWPTTTVAASMGADVAAAPPGPASDALVAFVRDDLHRPSAGTWNNDAPSQPPAPVAFDVPSVLVSRDVPAQEQPPSTSDAGSAEQVAAAPPSAAIDPSVRGVQPADGDVASAISVDVETALARVVPLLRLQSLRAPALGSSRQEVGRWLHVALDEALAATATSVKEENRGRLLRAAFDAVVGLGPIDALVEDQSVAAIFVDAPQSTFVERGGRVEPVTAIFDDHQRLQDVTDRLVDRIGGARADGRPPLVDRRLDDGTVVTIVSPPLAPGGPHVAIRRPAMASVTLEALAASGVMSPAMADLLRQAARGRLNVLVCGAAGASLVTAMALAAPTDDRVVSVAHSAATHAATARPILRIASDSGVGPRQTLGAALALRPDRLFVDAIEAAAMPDVVDAADRLEGLVVGVSAASASEAMMQWEAALRGARATLTSAVARRQVARAFPLVAEVERHSGVDRLVRLAEMPEDGDAAMTRDLFRFDARAGRFVASGLRMTAPVIGDGSGAASTEAERR
ncbi:MAG TPA: ATPase, T2SS/T4P/T4SS family [Vineibacter sp.]|nr:ATPase, T2SS/T4P/T4SS family [Vineibacter sp.]